MTYQQCRHRSEVHSPSFPFISTLLSLVRGSFRKLSATPTKFTPFSVERRSRSARLQHSAGSPRIVDSGVPRSSQPCGVIAVTSYRGLLFHADVQHVDQPDHALRWSSRSGRGGRRDRGSKQCMPKWPRNTFHPLGDQGGIGEISGAIIAITMVMTAVFIPVTFMTGPVGVFYRQLASRWQSPSFSPVWWPSR